MVLARPQCIGNEMVDFPGSPSRIFCPYAEGPALSAHLETTTDLGQVNSDRTTQSTGTRFAARAIGARSRGVPPAWVPIRLRRSPIDRLNCSDAGQCACSTGDD